MSETLGGQRHNWFAVFELSCEQKYKILMKRGAAKLRWAGEGDAQRSVLRGNEPKETGAERTSNFMLN